MPTSKCPVQQPSLATNTRPHPQLSCRRPPRPAESGQELKEMQEKIDLLVAMALNKGEVP